MCRVEERVYIAADGSRRTFDAVFPCDKAPQDKLCSNVTKTFADTYPDPHYSESHLKEIKDTEDYSKPNPTSRDGASTVLEDPSSTEVHPTTLNRPLHVVVHQPVLRKEFPFEFQDSEFGLTVDEERKQLVAKTGAEPKADVRATRTLERETTEESDRDKSAFDNVCNSQILVKNSRPRRRQRYDDSEKRRVSYCDSNVGAALMQQQQQDPPSTNDTKKLRSIPQDSVPVSQRQLPDSRSMVPHRDGGEAIHGTMKKEQKRQISLYTQNSAIVIPAQSTHPQSSSTDHSTRSPTRYLGLPYPQDNGPPLSTSVHYNNINPLRVSPFMMEETPPIISKDKDKTSQIEGHMNDEDISPIAPQSYAQDPPLDVTSDFPSQKHSKHPGLIPERIISSKPNKDNLGPNVVPTNPTEKDPDLGEWIAEWARRKEHGSMAEYIGNFLEDSSMDGSASDIPRGAFIDRVFRLRNNERPFLDSENNPSRNDESEQDENQSRPSNQSQFMLVDEKQLGNEKVELALEEIDNKGTNEQTTASSSAIQTAERAPVSELYHILKMNSINMSMIKYEQALLQDKEESQQAPLQNTIEASKHVNSVPDQSQTPETQDDITSVASSDADSMFSIESLASSATDLSRGSGYSTGQIAKATRELVLIFHEDKYLVSLYKSAIQSPAIGPERLQRNLRRLFKTYAESLEGEARDRLEYLASRLVSLKARLLSKSIIERFQDSSIPRKEKEAREESSDEDDTESFNERAFEDLIIFREFLVGSDAFRRLRTKVQHFVLSQTSKPSKLQEAEQICMDRQKNSKPKCQGRWSSLKHILDMLLIATGRLEPPLAPGTQRIRWKCKCGKTFFDDVTELQEGGVANLISRMKQSSGAKILSMSSSHNSNSQRYNFKSPLLFIQNAIRKISFSLRQTAKAPTLPQHNNSNTTATSQSAGNTPSQQGTLLLMACMHNGRYGKQLHQDRMETVNTDRKLFTFLKKQYTKHRGRFGTMISLKVVQGIYFVKFRLPIGGSVEVRHHDPCCKNSSCECIPPKLKVEPSTQAEYRCVPGPPSTYPPVLPEYLMHLFNSPSHINENETWIFDQLPKRICGELRGKTGQPAEGWGIYYQEGWDWDMIALIVFVVFLLGSLLFGILWSVLKMDVQGAFGVSAYMVTVCGILLSLVAMRTDRS